eukprot:6606915-Ditylum_brightwellii.AAC.1
MEKAGGSEDENSEAKYVKDIAHLYDSLLQDAQSVSSLPGGGDVNRFINTKGGGASATTGIAAMEEEKLEDEDANAN